MKRLFLLVVIFLALSGCMDTKPRWIGQDKIDDEILTIKPIDYKKNVDELLLQLIDTQSLQGFDISYDGEQPKILLQLEQWNSGIRTRKSSFIMNIDQMGIDKNSKKNKTVKFDLLVASRQISDANGELSEQVEIIIKDDGGLRKYGSTVLKPKAISSRGSIGYSSSVQFNALEMRPIWGLLGMRANQGIRPPGEFEPDRMNELDWALTLSVKAVAADYKE